MYTPAFLITLFDSFTIICSIIVIYKLIKLQKGKGEKINNILIIYLASYGLNSFGLLLGGIQIWIFEDKPDTWYCDIQGIIKVFSTILTIFYQFLIDLLIYLNVFYMKQYQRLVIRLRMIQIIGIVIMVIISLLPLQIQDINQISPFYKCNCFLDTNKNNIYNYVYVYLFIQIPLLCGFLFNIFIMAKLVYYYYNYAASRNQRRLLIFFILYPFIYFLTAFFQTLFLVLNPIYNQNQKNSIETFLEISFYIQTIRGGLIAIAFWLMKNFILMEKSKSGSLEMYTDLMDEEEDIKLEETF